jgi:hypothetical protein
MAAIFDVRSVSLIGYVGCLRVDDGGSPASVHQKVIGVILNNALQINNTKN